MERSFEVGDRVRACTSRPVPAGTLGRVHATLMSSVDVFFVVFDGEDRVRLMHVLELEIVTDEGRPR